MDIFTLSDDFVPQIERNIIMRKLLKLPLPVLCHLVSHWAMKYGTELKLDLESLNSTLDSLRKRKVKRRVLATRILLEYWPKGLHLYQLAQVDCYLLVHRPNSYYWNSSTAWNAKNEKSIVQLDFDRFVTNFRIDLQKFYLSDVHTFRHPDLPLMILRVQLFDYNNAFISKSPNLNLNGDRVLPHPAPRSDLSSGLQLISRSPYYIAFPMNSPNIIHSPDDDSYAKLIMQSVQKNLSDREPIILRINQSNTVRSLEAVQLLQGVSRYSNSLGPWACYADTSFEITPLSKIEEHQSIKGKRVLVRDDLPDDSVSHEVIRLRHEKAMIRFKGSKVGVRNRKAYELKRFTNRIHNPDKEISNPPIINPQAISKYSSLVPVEKVDFTFKSEKPESNGNISIKFKFRGKDVFGGLHELCDKQLINVDKVPGWLAGENGVDSGFVVEGNFIKKTSKGGLL